ncbi:Sensor histidine kinase BtsS [Zhongshania aliphaticivorans]|uniref:Sensor histidine kinase BtsS n=1 Tax=Zhongshania aliphaticivorans TaxID=1470434 RepID=A0A5S9QAV5_9GAMM|nr:histidine kinase [Zhongshania aliphaticivorans]CAA0102396.1 Sensor histidine kinase BtsS [Zhongshania aliphaticivorans]CAA0114330.1 Sensor histidine kinase BtsS [Zhongshania aliphaticivorans]
MLAGKNKTQLNSTLPESAPRVSFIGDLSSPQSLLVMVLLGSLLAIMYTLLKSGVQYFDWVLLGLSGMFTIWCLLGAAFILHLLKPVFNRLSTAATASCCFLICLLWVSCVAVLGQWFIHGNLHGVTWIFDGWAILEVLIVAAVLLGVGIRYAYISLQYRLREQSSLHARLDALHARIRPHFLFNSLNSISSLISSSPEKAEQAVEDLAALFRANLQNGMSIVSWSEERDLCERYLRIERSRLAERLQVNWQHTDLDGDVLVPSLLLQPLIENAIVHGIQLLPAGGVVNIVAFKNDDMIEIEVKNPVPTALSSGDGNGMASENIRLRLQALFGDRANFSGQLSNGQYRAKVVFPALNASSEGLL